MTDLELEIKHLIVDSLNLEDVGVEDIDSREAIFGEGLGLDSIDALELGIAIKKKYNITISADDPDVKSYFASVKDLAEFVVKNRK